jgi:hypothetical protein
MPRGDRTGPMGVGPLTGRGAGYCGGAGTPGILSSAGGRGGGRGWRHWFHATGLPGWARAGSGLPEWGAPLAPPAPIAADTASGAGIPALKAHAAHLEQTLHSLRQRIQSLERTAKPE